MMQYRQLGRAGVRMSIIGLGTNRFGTDQLPQEEVNKIIDVSLDLGINFIDAANTYVPGRCEETLGHALKGRRERFILTTKAALPMGDGPNDRGASRYHLIMTDAHYAIVEALRVWAAARGRSLNELAQAWLLAQPQVCSVISGATRLEHVLDNVKAASWGLSQTEVAEVNALLERGRPQS
jgi:aryl-alcohol dehydrogenase-like predicted oxidoreductase